MRCSIWRDNAIAAEVLVVGVHPSAEITAITPIVATILAYRIEALIDPVPDKATLHMWTTLHNIEILTEITRRVTHSVGKLAHNIWLLSILTCCILLHIGNRWIHRTDDIGIRATPRLLELYRARVITLLDPLILERINRTITTLITHRPDNHRWMVLITLDHSLNTVVMCSKPLLTPRWVIVIIGIILAHTTAVNLDVSLVNEQNTILIAEVVPLRRLRIVARAHSIDVELLHQRQILQHQLTVDDVTRSWIMLVNVNTIYHQALTI